MLKLIHAENGLFRPSIATTAQKVEGLLQGARFNKAHVGSGSTPAEAPKAVLISDRYFIFGQ